MPWDNDVSSNEATARSDETAQERDRDRKRRVGDHSEGPLGQSQVARISSDNCHSAVSETVLERAGSYPVKFHSDHPSPTFDQRSGDRTGPCTNIDYELARSDSRVGHQLLGPLPIELMPPPARPFPGHGGPSPRTSHSHVTAEVGN